MSTPAQRCAIAVELLEQALAPNGNGSEKVLKKGLKRHKIQLPDNEARKQLAQRMLGASCMRARLTTIVSAAAARCVQSSAGAGPAEDPLQVTPAMLLAAYALHEEPRLHHMYETTATQAAAAAANGGGSISNDTQSHAAAASLQPPPITDLGGYFEGCGMSDELMTSLASIDPLKDVPWPADPAARLAAERSLPQWIADTWIAELGQPQADALAQASNMPGPVYLRCNTLVCTREELLVSLKEEGMVAVLCTLSPWGVKILAPAKPNIWGSPAWKRGFFEVQDEGSQLIAMACTTDGRGFLPPGAVAVDTCAGRGGKTLCLAMASKQQLPGNAATAVAFDVDKRALQDLAIRLRRSKAGGLCCVAKEPTMEAVANAVTSHRMVYRDATTNGAPSHPDAGSVGAGAGAVAGAGAGAGAGATVGSSTRPTKRPKFEKDAAAVAVTCLGDTVPLEVADADKEQGVDAPVPAPAPAPSPSPAPRGADVVLVDAPCSRLGILRRGPGTRWELKNHPTVPLAEGLPAIQATLVAQGATLVAEGGILVYATCTIRNAENLDIVTQFEQSECGAEFEPAPLVEAFGANLAAAVMEPVIQHCAGAGAAGGGSSSELTANNAYCVTLMPHLHATDGFFIARWRRKASK